jgi:hypothetical protein
MRKVPLRDGGAVFNKSLEDRALLGRCAADGAAGNSPAPAAPSPNRGYFRP